MRVLIVDDDQSRQTLFEWRLPGEDLTHAFSYEQAKQALESARFDAVYLDYDLRQRHTGVDVARLIVGMPAESRPSRVIVHSAHPDGRHEVMDVLVAGDVPARLEPF